MSYIRSFSNPEALYVWGDVDGNVYWSVGGEDGFIMAIPQETFDGLMNKVAKRGGCVDHFDGSIEYKGAKLYQYVKNDGDDLWLADNWKIALEYNEQTHKMWDVTFNHVFNNWKRHVLRYQLIDAWGCFMSKIPWWVNPRLWFV